MIVGTIPSIEYKQDPGRGRAKAIVPAHEHEEETGCRNLAVDSARQERKRGGLSFSRWRGCKLEGDALAVCPTADGYTINVSSMPDQCLPAGPPKPSAAAKSMEQSQIPIGLSRSKPNTPPQPRPKQPVPPAGVMP